MKRLLLCLSILLFLAVCAWVLNHASVSNGEPDQQLAQDAGQADTNADSEWVGAEELDIPENEPGTGPEANYNQRAFPKGTIDFDAVTLSRAQMSAIRLQRPSGIVPQWIQRGPLNVQGRVTAIAVDPTDDNVAYVAAAEGGIFKTTDSGNSWTALFDDKSSLSMGAITLDPADSNVVFAGTGEVNPGRGSMVYGGTGLYRSTDGGATWTNIGLEDSGSIGRIVVHPTNSNIIHVAVMGHLWSPGPERGVYRTTDGGLTWNKVLYVDDITGCVDIIQRSDNPDVLLAAMWTRIRGPEAFQFGSIECAVYRSTDGGLTWSLEQNGLKAPDTDTSRIGLAISQSDPDVMCVIYTDGDGPFDGLYRTTDGGANWVRTNDGGLSNAFATFGWWFGNVRIHPTDPDTIFVVGFDDYRSTDGGSSWAQVGSNMHVDHHAFNFGSGTSPKMYAGNDGGVYISTDGANFTKTTGDLPITQTYRLAVASWNTDALWLGTQDNGTNQDLNGNGDFQRIFGGDGFEPVPHLTDSDRIWVQFQYGNVFYSDNGGNNFSNAGSGLSGRDNWNAPHAQDPNDPETRYFGTHRIYRNDGNTAWTQISGDLTGGPHQGVSGQVNGTLTTINVSPADSDIIWTGSDDGYVHVTQDGGTTWDHVSTLLPERWVTSVRPHPTEPAEALVSFSGFRWGEPIAHVYRTEDFGQTWTMIDSGLPDMPVNDVMYDPENTSRYFAATDLSVFQTFDRGQTWELLGGGLPNVVVNDFAFQANERKLFAGTYGRSIFELTLPEIVATTLTVVAGEQSGGDINSLLNSDNEDVSLNRGTSIQSRTVAEIKGLSHIAAPAQMTFTFEASVFARGNVTQTLSLYNYDTDQFEQIDSRNASRFNDQTVEITPTGDVSRFVEPGTNCVEARIEFSGATQRMQFTANIDRAFWSVSE
ncbi:MAG: hypothetical protein AAF456_19640 [Planctomycetota bacterium]